MKGLLRKEYYIFGGKQKLLPCILFGAVGILTNWLVIPVTLTVCLVLLPLTLNTKDDSARWWTYAKTLPYTCNQIVDAKYLFQLALILLFTLMLLMQYLVSVFLGRDPMNLFFMHYLFFINCIISAIAFPILFRFKRNGKKWLIAIVTGIIWFAVLMVNSVILPVFLINIGRVGFPADGMIETFIVIGGQRYQLTETAMERIREIVKWLTPVFSLAVYGLSWQISRRICKLKRRGGAAPAGSGVGSADSRFPSGTVSEAPPTNAMHAAKRGFCNVTSPPD